jgi:large subunit ribosomal protein L3
MEFLVEKIGMSRTLSVPSTPVTLLKIKEAKVCEVSEGKALIAYSEGKNINKAIMGQQKKYNLSKEFNKFATVAVSGAEVGDLSTEPLANAKRVKVTLNTKGRGFTGVMKRWNFSGGPGGHGHRFHRTTGSIGNREWPGRVQRGKKMAGQYGNETVTVQNEILSFDAENNVLVLKGSIPGFNGASGKIKVVK